MTNRIGIMSLCIVIPLMLISISAYAEDGWEANLTIAIAHIDSRLSFGQRADATDGMDGLYDVPAMITGELRAYFINTDGFFWREIKGLEGKKLWSLRLVSPLKGQPVTLKWNPRFLPKDRQVVLIDIATGVSVDMKLNSQYSYRNDGLRDFRLEVAR